MSVRTNHDGEWLMLDVKRCPHWDCLVDGEHGHGTDEIFLGQADPHPSEPRPGTLDYAMWVAWKTAWDAGVRHQDSSTIRSYSRDDQLRLFFQWRNAHLPPVTAG